MNRDRARAELIGELERSPPDAIVVVKGDVREGVTGSRRDSRSELETFPELGRLLDEAYEPVWTGQDLTILLPRPSD